MHNLLTVLGAIVPVFLVVAGGWLLRRLNWLTTEADASLLRVTVNVLFPCLAFDSLLGNDALARPGNVVLPPLVGFGSVLLGIGVSSAVARVVPATTPSARRTFVFSASLYNYGYVPLPLAMTLFDGGTVGVLLVHNVGVEIALWVSTIVVLAGGGWRDGLRLLRSPPLVAIFLTLALNAVLPRAAVPGVVLQTTHWLGQCAIPLALLLTGAVMADHAGDVVGVRGGRVMLLACAVRLGVLPMVFLGAARVLPVPVELKEVMVLQAAMPAVVVPLILTRHYGGDPATAFRVLAATTLAGLVTMPLWLRFGLQFVGLAAGPTP